MLSSNLGCLIYVNIIIISAERRSLLPGPMSSLKVCQTDRPWTIRIHRVLEYLIRTSLNLVGSYQHCAAPLVISSPSAVPRP